MSGEYALVAQCRASRTSSCRSWMNRPVPRSPRCAIGIYGAAGIRALRSMTNATVNKEPKWRHNRPELTTGYSAP